MKLLVFLNRFALVTMLCAGFLLSPPVFATKVEVRTTVGNFVINLFDFDEDVRATVDNFLAYVEAGRYDDSYFHRLSPGFVLQGGGYVYGGVFPAPQDSDLNLQEVVLDPGMDNPTVDNQPKYSNVRGTVTMAKVGGDPDSATSQWFINLADNASNLDIQNGGFTVFGIVESGMDVVEALADFDLLVPPADPEPDTAYFYQSPLGELPLQDYTTDDFLNNLIPNGDNLALITEVLVDDATVDTASGLTIVRNDLIVGFRPTPITPQPDFKDGGGVSWLFLLVLSSLLYFRRKSRY